jgi:hypothetical protein
MQQEALGKFDRIKPGLKEAILGQHYRSYRESYPLSDEGLDETQEDAADNLAMQLGRVGVDYVRVISRGVLTTSVGDITSTAVAARLSTATSKVAESVVIGAARVIVCTCSMALCRRLSGKTFSFVLIDEATQALSQKSLQPWSQARNNWY